PHSRANRDAGFTGDGSEIWISGPPPPTNRLGLVQLTGGPLRPFLDDKAFAVDWSPDGKRLLYVRNPPNMPGDPLYVADRDGSNPRQIYMDPATPHNHFPTWSADGRWIYFTHGKTTVDLWRISAE